jgi:hypothetical protein
MWGLGFSGVGAGLADVAGAHRLREPRKFQRGADVAGGHWLQEQINSREIPARL